jgi:hypothetical protein
VYVTSENIYTKREKKEEQLSSHGSPKASNGKTVGFPAAEKVIIL